jgi:hypothetical protein
MINNSSSTSDAELYKYNKNKFRKNSKESYASFWYEKNLFWNIIDN